MKKVSIIFVVLSSLISFVPAVLGANVPKTIENSKTTTLSYNYGKHGGCSATRVAENLVLSAAHCVFGYNGDERVKNIRFENDGKEYRLKIVESGKFKPKKGEMGDWVLLEAVDGPKVFKEVKVADFPTKNQLSDILKDLGDFLGKKKGAPVWTITYPASSIRQYPRPAPDGKNVFLSRKICKDLGVKEP